MQVVSYSRKEAHHVEYPFPRDVAGTTHAHSPPRRFAAAAAGHWACYDEATPTSPAFDPAYTEESADPGTGEGRTEVTLGSIIPVVSEQGMVTLSVDAMGTTATTGLIQVDKPAGATVRAAYLAAASTGFSGRRLNNGDIHIDGVPVTWSISTPSSIASWNHWADVTSIVKGKIDGSAPGRVDFLIAENPSFGIDGVILAVIFDDPAVTTENTVVLQFGAQDILGDHFFVDVAEPIDTSDPDLVLEMGSAFPTDSSRALRRASWM